MERMTAARQARKIAGQFFKTRRLKFSVPIARPRWP
jgi:hypothetical protein